MTTHMAIAVSCLVLLSLNSVLAQSSSPPKCGTVVDKPILGGIFTTSDCIGGTWPTAASGVTIASLIPRTTQILFIDKVAFPLNAAVERPLVSADLPNLKKLNVENLRSFDASNASIAFAFKQWTSGLSQSAITELDVTTVSLPDLAEDMFDGFPALKKLVLNNCGISTIHPRTLSPLAALSEFTITSDKALTVFPWEAVRPVAGTIQEVMIHSSPRLSAITAAQLPAGFALHTLDWLTIYKTNVTIFPNAILESVAGSTRARLDFKSNPNDCGSCVKYNQAPLVDWVGGDAGRWLELTCRLPDGTERSASGDLKHFLRNPNCLLVSPTQPPVTAPTVTAPTVTAPTVIATTEKSGVEAAICGRSLTVFGFLFLRRFI
ncbi:hypothetical protein BV898_18145 [Hypsibius exemplaris]|uniref:Uncharacterized protein n=1 Tax=Hypsibius exemplaris TaxID=2072580 RepID=A0A9X6NJH4_HYPEX|nr:hypothetical protein BV898_18145 [Hypsibius exemplaris]